MNEVHWIAWGSLVLLESGTYVVERKGKSLFSKVFVPMVSFLLSLACFPLLLHFGLQQLVQIVVFENKNWALAVFFIFLIVKILTQKAKKKKGLMQIPFLSLLIIPLIINGLALHHMGQTYWVIAGVGSLASACTFFLLDFLSRIWIEEGNQAQKKVLYEAYTLYFALCVLLFLGTLKKLGEVKQQWIPEKMTGFEWVVVVVPILVGVMIKMKKENNATV